MTNVFKVTPMPISPKGHQAYGELVDTKTSEWKNPPDPPVYRNYSIVKEILETRSVSTPNWNVPKAKYITLPKAQKPVSGKLPVAPRYRPPKPLREPFRIPGSSDRSWNTYMRKFSAKQVLQRKKIDAYESEFAKRMINFNRKMEAFQQRISRKQAKADLTFLKRAGVITFSQNNPYFKLKISDTNFIINFTYTHYMKIVKDPNTGAFIGLVNGQPGDAVYEQNCAYGIDDGAPSFWYYGGNGHPFPDFRHGVVPSELINECSLEAGNKLNSKLKNSSAHIGNMLAERAKTYDMLISSIERLASFLRSPKKAVTKYITGAGFTRRVADDHLMYAFGVQPLVNDVYQLTKDLNDICFDVNKSDMVKVGASSSRSGTRSWEDNTAFYDTKYYETYEVTVRHTAEYRVDNSTLATLGRFGLINPAEVLWEITPWSFVIDWFLPVGAFLSNLTADLGLQYATGTYSVRTKITTTMVRKYKPYAFLNDQGRYWSGEIRRTKTTEQKSREISSSPPAVTLPRFKSPLSLRHLGLSLSLWRQRF